MVEGLPRVRRVAIAKANKNNMYQLIQENEDWGIRWLCELLEVSRGAYYKWKHRKESLRDKENKILLEKIRTIVESNNSLFGKLKMTDYINQHRKEDEAKVNHKRVYRLMCINGIKSQMSRHTHSTYKKNDPEEVAENILNREFQATKPNEKWCTDITEKKIPGTKEKVYISTIIDLYDSYPVSMCVSRRNDTILVNETLDKAVSDNPGAMPLFHSDRGFQYTRAVFKKKLEDLGMIQSMSRVSKCIDNGPIECFQGIFKELIDVLYPDVHSYMEMVAAIYAAYDYYINEYPLHRFGGKTAGQVRKEALEVESPTQYPIPKNNRIMKYWDHIHTLQSARL